MQLDKTAAKDEDEFERSVDALKADEDGDEEFAEEERLRRHARRESFEPTRTRLSRAREVHR